MEDSLVVFFVIAVCVIWCGFFVSDGEGWKGWFGGGVYRMGVKVFFLYHINAYNQQCIQRI